MKPFYVVPRGRVFHAFKECLPARHQDVVREATKDELMSGDLGLCARCEARLMKAER